MLLSADWQYCALTQQSLWCGRCDHIALPMLWGFFSYRVDILLCLFVNARKCSRESDRYVGAHDSLFVVAIVDDFNMAVGPLQR